jgi:hypothetical protein
MIFAVLCAEASPRTAAREAIDTVLVRSLDVTGDGKADTISLHLTAKSLSSPFSWTLSISSQGHQIYALSGNDTRIDTLFHDKGYVDDCRGYLDCKKKYYFHDILDGLEVPYNLNGILDRSHSNTLYSVGSEYLGACCAIKGSDADTILSRMEARLRSGKAVVLTVPTSPMTSEHPMMFAPEVNRFIPIYME